MEAPRISRQQYTQALAPVPVEDRGRATGIDNDGVTRLTEAP